jgi:hypothetical protein
MMRQRLKTIGAPLAQIGLRRQRKNPTHGVVAGAANNALPCVGAALAQDASRAHPNSPAPRHQCSASGDALLPHRWSPAGSHFTHDQYPPPHCAEVDHAGMHARVRAGWKALFANPFDRYSLAARGHLDQQSQSLLAIFAIIVDCIDIYTIDCRGFSSWEMHGKIGEAEAPSLGKGPDHLSKSRGGGGNSVARRYIDVPPPYTAASCPVLSAHCGALLGFSARRIVSPNNEECLR